MYTIIVAQFIATLIFAITVICFAAYILQSMKLRNLFNRDYLRSMSAKRLSRFYPLVPRNGSTKYLKARKFLSSIGWNIRVEGVYICKWSIFSISLFLLVTIYTTSSMINIRDIIKDPNYRRSVIESNVVSTPERMQLERQLFMLVDQSLVQGRELYHVKQKNIYVEFIEDILNRNQIELKEDKKLTAQRLYYKVLQIRLIRNSIMPFIQILLISALLYNLPDILGQIKKKLIEDKKNWEILNCLIVFSIFGRMPPYSVAIILGHMVLVTEVYKPLLNELNEALKRGGDQAAAFDAALQAVDREELYELIETMKLAKRTGLGDMLNDMEDTITNTVKWIEIENITRRRSKMLYAMTATAIVMGIGCIYFAYGLTVITNPANMIIK